MGNNREFGECRCCLTKGNHRSLIKEYYKDGRRVVFKEHLLECFNVFLSPGENITSLICNSCIRRLHEARSFRALVLRSERRLQKARGKASEMEFVNVLLPNEDMESAFIKQETESCDSPHAVEYDDSCELDSCQDVVPGERELLDRFDPGTLQPLPTRDTLLNICPVFYNHLETLKGKIVTARAIEALNDHTRDKDNINISEKLAQAINATTLLENSNATVFKSKMRSGFPCFYCRNIFVNPKSLREHQLKHPKSHLYKLLTKYTADSLVVYADVTNLKCIICSLDVYNLKGLKSHLTVVHNKKYYDDFSDRVIPFRLEDKENHFDCQLCGRNFETFGATDRHMNEHFRNYVCEACGSGFVTRHRLKVHTYLLHSKLGVIKCEICKKIFASKYKFKIHNEYVHKKLKKMQCSQCSEKFIDYFSRQRHMEEKHGVELLSYKCTQCDRAFNRKYSLTCHVKRIHLAKKDVQCDLCPFMCYNKSELRDHMVKHGGVKSFVCQFCQKTFARKKTLTVHMRVHSETKKYNCHFCGEAFAQISSLQSHLKSHKSEYVDV